MRAPGPWVRQKVGKSAVRGGEEGEDGVEKRREGWETGRGGWVQLGALFTNVVEGRRVKRLAR